MPSLTQEQITQARETDLLDYLLSHESGVLKREGANYRHREHDSLVYVASKNYWYWNSRGRKINAVDYLMEIRGTALWMLWNGWQAAAPLLFPVTQLPAAGNSGNRWRKSLSASPG